MAMRRGEYQVFSAAEAHEEPLARGDVHWTRQDVPGRGVTIALARRADAGSLPIVSEYFQVDAVERSSRELVLRVTVIDGNPNAFHIERNFALMLALDAGSRDNPLTRDIARQLGYSGNLYDDDVSYEDIESTLATLSAHYIDQVEIVATENLNPTARASDSGSIGWTAGAGIGSTATYRLLFTQGRWIEHIKAGDRWTSAAYDTSYGEELDREYLVEVLERAAERIVLRVRPISPHADPVSDSPRFALGLLVERAQVPSQTSPRRLSPATRASIWAAGSGLPALEFQDDDVMIAAAPDYIESVVQSDSEGGTVTLDVVVTDPSTIEAFEPGLRWLAFGFV
jgi:hypothetical protein